MKRKTATLEKKMKSVEELFETPMVFNLLVEGQTIYFISCMSKEHWDGQPVDDSGDEEGPAAIPDRLPKNLIKRADTSPFYVG